MSNSRPEPYFDVSEVVNESRIPDSPLIATSLFWKQANSGRSALGPISLSAMMTKKRFSYGKNVSAWSQYVLPLLEAAKRLRGLRPDVTFRVYLANDLRFLLGDLAAAGCEVYLMVHSSLAHNPGAMWRFLALEEGARGVTIVDADRGERMLSDLARTESLLKSELGTWRVPYEFGVNYARNSIEGYRPINASQFGVSVDYPVKALMSDFVDNSIKGVVPNSVEVRDNQKFPIAGTTWPDYGFDEWFLQQRLYPIMAKNGMVTFVPGWARPFSQFLQLDIEFVTRSNSDSEVVFFDKPARYLSPDHLAAYNIRRGLVKNPRGKRESPRHVKGSAKQLTLIKKTNQLV